MGKERKIQKRSLAAAMASVMALSSVPAATLLGNIGSLTAFAVTDTKDTVINDLYANESFLKNTDGGSAASIATNGSVITVTKTIKAGDLSKTIIPTGTSAAPAQAVYFQWAYNTPTSTTNWSVKRTGVMYTDSSTFSVGSLTDSDFTDGPIMGVNGEQTEDRYVQWFGLTYNTLYKMKNENKDFVTVHKISCTTNSNTVERTIVTILKLDNDLKSNLSTAATAIQGVITANVDPAVPVYNDCRSDDKHNFKAGCVDEYGRPVCGICGKTEMYKGANEYTLKFTITSKKKLSANERILLELPNATYVHYNSTEASKFKKTAEEVSTNKKTVITTGAGTDTTNDDGMYVHNVTVKVVSDSTSLDVSNFVIDGVKTLNGGKYKDFADASVSLKVTNLNTSKDAKIAAAETVLANALKIMTDAGGKKDDINHATNPVYPVTKFMSTYGGKSFSTSDSIDDNTDAEYNAGGFVEKYAKLRSEIAEAKASSNVSTTNLEKATTQLENILGCVKSLADAKAEALSKLDAQMDAADKLIAAMQKDEKSNSAALALINLRAAVAVEYTKLDVLDVSKATSGNVDTYTEYTEKIEEVYLTTFDGNKKPAKADDSTTNKGTNTSGCAQTTLMKNAIDAYREEVTKGSADVTIKSLVSVYNQIKNELNKSGVDDSKSPAKELKSAYNAAADMMTIYTDKGYTSDEFKAVKTADIVAMRDKLIAAFNDYKTKLDAVDIDAKRETLKEAIAKAKPYVDLGKTAYNSVTIYQTLERIYEKAVTAVALSDADLKTKAKSADTDIPWSVSGADDKAKAMNYLENLKTNLNSAATAAEGNVSDGEKIKLYTAQINTSLEKANGLVDGKDDADAKILKNAVSEAEKARDDKAATPTTLKSAAEKIASAIDVYELAVVKTSIANIVKEAESDKYNVKGENKDKKYTSESWTAFTDALKAAQDAQKTLTGATKENLPALKKIVSDLDDAMKGLTTELDAAKEIVAKAEAQEKLVKSIEAANAAIKDKTEADFAEGKYAAVRDALVAAEELKDDAKSKDIIAVYEAIDAAVKGLTNGAALPATPAATATEAEVTAAAEQAQAYLEAKAADDVTKVDEEALKILKDSSTKSADKAKVIELLNTVESGKMPKVLGDVSSTGKLNASDLTQVSKLFRAAMDGDPVKALEAAVKTGAVTETKASLTAADLTAIAKAFRAEM